MLYLVSEPFEGCILVRWTEKPCFVYLFIRAQTLDGCHLLVTVSGAAVNVRSQVVLCGCVSTGFGSMREHIFL